MGERRLKVADVARETGIHRNSLTTLYRDEAERIDVEMIEKLCAFFGCAVGDLLEYVPERRPGKRERAQ
jgi:putative transcriptional regulator